MVANERKIALKCFLCSNYEFSSINGISISISYMVLSIQLLHVPTSVAMKRGAEKKPRNKSLEKGTHFSIKEFFNVVLVSYCREACYEQHDWRIIADRGTSLSFYAWIGCDSNRYVFMRFTVIWYGKVTIDIFQVTWSVTISFQMKFLIWSKHRDTSHQVRTPVYVQIRPYTLQFVHYEPFCSVTIRHNNDGNSSLSKWKVIMIWPQ